MILETGKNLSILIITDNDMNWQTFATWYSFYKNLPDSKIAIFCHRTESVPFMYFQWAKRLNIPRINGWPFVKDGPDVLNWLAAVNQCEQSGVISQPVLVVQPYVMALDLLEKSNLEKFSQKNILEKNIFFIKNINTKNAINEYFIDNKKIESSESEICLEANETNLPVSVVSYRKGCGRWIDTAKGCPFSSAGGLATSEMTINENKIIELWNKMVPLYSAVS